MNDFIIKICGMTSLADARCALDAGADWLGFIFYPKSPRYIAPEDARAIIDALPEGTPTVGIFVNEELEQVRATASRAGIGAVQCHGWEPPDFLRRLAPLQVLKATALTSRDDIEALAPYAEWPLIVDTPTPEHGGSGKTGDWELAACAAARYRILLAGGLRPENVAEAIRRVAPWGVDVCSGVERTRGQKDHARVRVFVAAARAAFAVAGG